MRRRILTLGLLLILLGVFVFDQGPRVLTPLAQALGLVRSVRNETVLIPRTLVPIPANDYTYLSVDLEQGTMAVGALELADAGELAFYVMTEGNFSVWKAGQPSKILLGKTFTLTYNFSFPAQESGTYFFVLYNSESTRRLATFYVDSLKYELVLSAPIQYLAFELLIVGFLLATFGATGGRKKAEHLEEQKGGWKCRFCAAQNMKETEFCENCGRSRT